MINNTSPRAASAFQITEVIFHRDVLVAPRTSGVISSEQVLFDTLFLGGPSTNLATKQQLERWSRRKKDIKSNGVGNARANVRSTFSDGQLHSYTGIPE
ncbi:hypothetical protein WA026_015076 [Henosepilachna vigintioctopunctata]|uniref:Uncharacterized protein n=1 Tax=Henosepilachna vigintioctopunctata TaxID=420089 RepID=A0AAW1U7D5_9CUCU